MLFGASGYNQHRHPDNGIRQYGPFQYGHNYDQ